MRNSSSSAAPPTRLNYVGGTWRAAADGALFPNENPARKGETLGFFPRSTAADADAAVRTAHEAFKTWRRSPLDERQRLVRAFIRRLEAGKEELARIVSLENGKTIRESRAEVDTALAEGRFHVDQCATFGGSTMPRSSAGFLGWTEPCPVGVFALISPWNFPINIVNRKTLPALLTGNTVVFKPAEFTSWSADFLSRLFHDAGFPPGVFNCLHGQGRVAGMALVRHPLVRGISFTGSTAVGKIIQVEAGQRLCRTQLELGGKNAAIVMADADIDAALEAVMTAGFACAGQWCTSTSRVLLQKTIADEFTERLKARCEGLAVGDPLDEKTEMGPVAGPVQFQTITGFIDKAKQEGSRLITGDVCRGDLGERGYFIRPTLFDRVTPEMTIFREEVFGPVLSLSTFHALDEAMDMANAVEYGLSSAIFTRDLDAATRYVRDIESGLAHVNIHSGYKHPALPFGGWKNSGYGPPENGREGIEFFIDWKAVYVKSP
jgi:aldehyde dehydrogenase (NAD+)